jgi:hypothetical protein
LAERSEMSAYDPKRTCCAVLVDPDHETEIRLGLRAAHELGLRAAHEEAFLDDLTVPDRV